MYGPLTVQVSIEGLAAELEALIKDTTRRSGTIHTIHAYVEETAEYWRKQSHPYTYHSSLYRRNQRVFVEVVIISQQA